MISGCAPLRELLEGRNARSCPEMPNLDIRHFKTVVGHADIGFEISFRHAQEAELFQQRFASLVPGLGQTLPYPSGGLTGCQRYLAGVEGAGWTAVKVFDR